VRSEERTKSLSAALVAGIRRTHGKNNRQIAHLIGVSESFLSRVANGKHNFTFEHLARIERALNTPLPRLLLVAVREDDSSVPDSLRSEYKRILDLLEASARIDLATKGEKGPD
jgi:transcriptional regulator with XRE-family HTH domain